MAKKRHYSSVKSSSTEDGRAIISNGYYSGEADRRRMEMQDAGMISEDHSAVANLPQGVVMRPYPKSGSYIPEVLDDTIRGIDGQIDLDDSQRRRNFLPKKV